MAKDQTPDGESDRRPNDELEDGGPRLEPFDRLRRVHRPEESLWLDFDVAGNRMRGGATGPVSAMLLTAVVLVIAFSLWVFRGAVIAAVVLTLAWFVALYLLWRFREVRTTTAEGRTKPHGDDG